MKLWIIYNGFSNSELSTTVSRFDAKKNKYKTKFNPVIEIFHLVAWFFYERMNL